MSWTKDGLWGPTNPTFCLWGKDTQHYTHMLSPVHLSMWWGYSPSAQYSTGSPCVYVVPHKLWWVGSCSSTLLISRTHVAVGENMQLLSRGCNSRHAPASLRCLWRFLSIPTPFCIVVTPEQGWASNWAFCLSSHMCFLQRGCPIW